MDEDLERQVAIAEPVVRDFYDGWHEAVARYAEYDPAHTAEHDDSTRAANIRCHMFYEVVRRLDTRPGCIIRNIRGLKVLIWQNVQVWRFKQVDASGRHKNYQTPQQEDFDDQWPLPELPDVAVRLTSGYVLNTAGAIERIISSRVLGHDMLWAAQLLLESDGIKYTDITPDRLAGTGTIDFDAGRARARRGRRR